MDAVLPCGEILLDKSATDDLGDALGDSEGGFLAAVGGFRFCTGGALLGIAGAGSGMGALAGGVGIWGARGGGANDALDEGAGIGPDTGAGGPEVGFTEGFDRFLGLVAVAGAIGALAASSSNKSTVSSNGFQLGHSTSKQTSKLWSLRYIGPAC